MKLKLRDIAFESNAKDGTGSIINGEQVTRYKNAIEAWNVFTSIALRPFEIKLRDELEQNGFNRWTGIKDDNPTETELKNMDEHQAIRKAALYDI